MTFRPGLNPVTVKELRQMVRSRMVSVGLVVYLFAQLAGVGLVLLSATGEASSSGLYGQALGQSVFQAIYFLLSFLLLLCLPLFMGTRLGLERGKEHLDLQYITALKPQQFVDGKVASAGVLTIVFASASLPFFVLCYLLRGVDLFQIMGMFGGLLLTTVCSLYGTLFLGAVGVTRTLRVFLLLGVVGSLLFLMGLLNAGTGFLFAGSGSGSHGSLLWIGLMLMFAAWWCGLARAVTVAALSPAHANRALPVRVWFTAFWLFCGLLALAAGLHESDGGYVRVWALLSVLLFAGLQAVAASQPSGYSRRVLAAGSARRPVRALQFFFYSGAESGMAWAMALGFLSVLADAAAGALAFDWTNGTELLTSQVAAVYLYLTASVCAVRAVWSYGLHRLAPPKLVGIVAALLVALCSSVPYLLALDEGAAGVVFAERAFGNVVGVFSGAGADSGRHLLYAGAAALLEWSFCAPLLRRAFAQFVGATPRAAAGGLPG